MKRSLALALVLVAGGLVAAHASGAPKTGTLLGGWVQVVAYSDANVRICPDYAVAAARRVGSPSGPPSYCSTGLPVIGVQTAALTNQSTNPTQSWGYVYLTGTYDGDTFTVSTQSTTDPGYPEFPSLTTPPCSRPSHGWRLALPTDAQWHAVKSYQRRYRHDIVGLEMFSGGSHVGAILTIASTHPRRAHAALVRAWPRQLCVIRSHYTMSQFRHAQKEMVKLLMANAGATYGWVSSAGGGAATESGQPATGLGVLIETPQLTAILDQQPKGLVTVDATLHPVAAG